MLRHRSSFLVAVLLVVAPVAAHAGSKTALEKPVRILIGAVRYKKDALALKLLAGNAQGEALLGDTWKKATPKQRAEFVRLFHELFAGIAFPKIRANFKYLDTILYENPKVHGSHASIESTLVILNPLKKEELRVHYDLVKVHGAWKVLDVKVLGTGGKSMLTDIREQQIQPILAEGGLPHLLDLMRKRAAEVKQAAK